MKTFFLNRKEDVSGVSGTGIVAEGVIFSDGQVVLSWFGQHHSITIWPSLDDMLAVHGHEGRTEIVNLAKVGAARAKSADPLSITPVSHAEGRRLASLLNMSSPSTHKGD